MDTYYNPITQSKENIVFIDTINSFFAWYYKSMKVYNKSRHNKKGSLININDEKVRHGFLSVFETTFIRNLKKISHITKSETSNIIFAIDCSRNDVWRNDILRNTITKKSSYKATRNTRIDPGIPLTMKYMYDVVMPKYNCIRIGAPRAEADDVIAILTLLMNHKEPSRLVYIISDDSDFIQLLKHPSNNILNQRFRSIRNKIPFSPTKMLEMKILQGDRIDNIESAFPRVGSKTAEMLFENKTTLEKKIKIYGRERLERNRTLIDFNYIPNNIKSLIIQNALLIKSFYNNKNVSQ
jgi:5'-3' exonuclease